jgi:hypothetical protein
MTTYVVKISRKFKKLKIDRFMEGEFWWDVDANANGLYMSDLSDCGWAKSLDKAKAKALNHILKVEKTIGDGDKFGVMLNIQGTAAEVTKALV